LRALVGFEAHEPRSGLHARDPQHDIDRQRWLFVAGLKLLQGLPDPIDQVLELREDEQGDVEYSINEFAPRETHGSAG
jgi:hypothetical protein